MILITGASSGIGEATARVFAEKGKSLILVARRKEKLENLAQELRARHSIEVHVFELDVRDLQAVRAFFQNNPALLKRVEVLVNNAGLAKGFRPFQETTPDEWDAMLDTNVKGVLAMTREILLSMIQRGRGHIVILGSVAGRWAYSKGNVYCASKAAMHSFAECLRLDLHGTGIRVTEISPGKVETEFSLVRLDDPIKAKAVYEGMRSLSAQDIAETILWSVDRPAHVNIQEIVIYPTDQASPTSPPPPPSTAPRG